MKKYILFLALLASLAAPQNAGAAVPVPVALTPAQQKDLARLEDYMNSLRAITARFLQVSEGGAIREGELALLRPGKMRITYAPPDKDFMVADGTFLHSWDSEIKGQTSLPLSSTPAAFLLRDKISFHDDVVLTGFSHENHLFRVTLTGKENPEEGALTLIFEDNPLLLRQWRVLDAQGNTTGVQLENLQTNVTFPKNTFIFVSPKRSQAYPR